MLLLSLGMCTRNIGAALASLFAVPDVDQRAIVMVAFGVLMQAIFSFAAASYFGRRAKIAEPGAAPTAAAATGGRVSKELPTTDPWSEPGQGH